MEERHAHQVHCFFIKLPHHTRSRNERKEVVVCEHHTFRATRGTTGVQLKCNIFWLRSNMWVNFAARGNKGFIRNGVQLAHRRTTSANDDDHGCRVELVGNRFSNRSEVFTHHQHGGTSIIHDVFHFRCSQAPVHVDTYGVQQCASVKHFKVLNGVFVEKRHAVACFHSRGAQRLSHLTRAFVEFTPRLAFLAQHECCLLGALGAVNPNNVTD